MSIALKLSTILNESGEPSTAYHLDISDTYEERELSQFYLYLKHICRNIEIMIDENIKERLEDE